LWSCFAYSIFIECRHSSDAGHRPREWITSLNKNQDAPPDDSAEWGISSHYIDGLGRDVPVDSNVIARVREALFVEGQPAARRKTMVLRHGQFRIGGFPARESSAWNVLQHGRVVATAKVENDALTLQNALVVGAYELAHRGDDAPPVNLIVAPRQTYQGAGDGHPRTWLIAVQLYGVRSRHNWGHGDFSDLAILLDCAARYGAGGIGVNPLHILFDDRPGHISPYSPNSRCFIDPLYIDVSEVGEFPGLAALNLEAELQRLRACERVDYSGVRAAKFKALRACYAAFRNGADPDRLKDFELFRAESGPALRRFACFETLRRHFNAPWWSWPREWLAPGDSKLTALASTNPEEVELHEYVQWIADRQLAACAAKAKQLGLPVGLYLDLAVGVVPDGADAWINQSIMLGKLSIGAPPDPFNLRGQNWGLTTFSPTGMATDQYRAFRHVASAVMRHAGAIRVDHVLGFERLFVIPDNVAATDGTYIDFPFEVLAAVIAEQSQRHRCIVIGEDLGTVPQRFRAKLADWGLWSYRVMQFERDREGGFVPPRHYPENALVTFTTHDLPTYAGWWSGHDLRVRRAVGMDQGAADEQRENDRRVLRRALEDEGAWSDGDVVDVIKFLAATPSRIVAVPLEDILGLLDQPNLPGTVDEYPNWRLRTPIMIEDLELEPRLSRIAAVMAGAKRSQPTAK
jgi:4-alpha-glucanotransferase